MFLSLDGTFWVQLVSFGIFLALLDALFLKPVGAAIVKRRAYIDGVKGDLERFEREASGLRSTASEERGAARRAADERILKARADADAKAAAIAADASARAQSVTTASQAVAATELATARVGIDDRSRELAGTLLTRVLGTPPAAPPERRP